MNLFPGIKSANNRAILGFLIPFFTAALGCGFILWKRGRLFSSSLLIPFLILIPSLLILGTVLSIKSFEYIEKKGDKDYAYSGFVFNLFLLALYIFTLFISIFKYS